MFATENGHEWWTVGEYRDAHPECTGELVDAAGDILADDDEITVGHGQYCVGRYDGNQLFMDRMPPAPIMDRR